MPKKSPPALAKRLVAEFIGTALLLSVVIGSAIMSAKLMGGNSGLELLAQAIAVGAALCVLIMIFGPISGAHFNPAVSLAFVLLRQLERKECIYYIFAQFAGGFAGVLIAHLMFDLDAFQISDTTRSGTGQWLGEFIATFALLAAILGLLRTSPQNIPMAVGLIIAAGYWYTSSTTFANPAVTFARMFTTTSPGIQPGDAPAFIAVQCVTAVATVYLFSWFEKE